MPIQRQINLFTKLRNHHSIKAIIIIIIISKTNIDITSYSLSNKQQLSWPRDFLSSRMNTFFSVYRALPSSSSFFLVHVRNKIQWVVLYTSLVRRHVSEGTSGQCSLSRERIIRFRSLSYARCERESELCRPHILLVDRHERIQCVRIRSIPFMIHDYIAYNLRLFETNERGRTNCQVLFTELTRQHHE